MSDQDNENVTALAFTKDLLLGGISGAVAKTLTAPIERVQMLLQTQAANPLIRSGEIPRFSGITDCFTRVAREQGMTSFWRGNLTNVLRYFPTQAINVALRDPIKKLFPRYSTKDEYGKFFMVQMGAGLLAGLGASSVAYPLYYARIRLATDAGRERVFKGLTDCLVKTATGPNGFFGLYKGFTVSLLNFLPLRFMYFGVYDTLREMNPYRNDLGMLGVASRFAIAQTSALVMAYAFYPIDTVVRRLQMQGELPREQWMYRNGLDCFKKVWKEGMFAGAGANALKTVSSALVLVLYDQLQEMLERGNGANDQ